jgi:ubiquitin-like-conjugating enzyme ATG3
VQAGDNLTKACPAWKWQSSTKGYEHRYLPSKEQQFLMMENVRCAKRVKDIMGKAQFKSETVEDGELIVLGKDEPEEAKEAA